MLLITENDNILEDSFSYNVVLHNYKIVPTTRIFPFAVNGRHFLRRTIHKEHGQPVINNSVAAYTCIYRRVWAALAVRVFPVQARTEPKRCSEVTQAKHIQTFADTMEY